MVVAKEQRSGAWVGALNSRILELQEENKRLKADLKELKESLAILTKAIKEKRC